LYCNSHGRQSQEFSFIKPGKIIFTLPELELMPALL